MRDANQWQTNFAELRSHYETLLAAQGESFEADLHPEVRDAPGSTMASGGMSELDYGPPPPPPPPARTER